MRIGIDARFFGGEQSKGLGRYTQKLVEHLLTIDKKNQYVIFLQETEYASWKLKLPNVEIVQAPYRWYTLAEQILMPVKIKQYNVDFMHFPHFNVPLLYRGPFVVTIHDLIISRFPTERATTLGPFKYRIKQMAYNRVITHAARHAKKIITVSEYSKKDIMDFFKLPEDRIAVTYEAVDAFTEMSTEANDVSEVETARILKQYAITHPYVLYIGNAYPHKNLETVLQVVSTLKKQGKLFFKLVLVGREDYFYLRLQQKAWALDIENEVVFPGFVPDTHLPVLYKNALTYVFPSKYEGFGLPPLEAMAYGTPVLAARASCLPEILGKAALYFDIQDVSGIIKQIFSVQQNQELRRQLVYNGYEQLKKYHWKILAQQTLQIYESVFTKP
jgi:glycosyltransferase involved in cell wall biosynthesis